MAIDYKLKILSSWLYQNGLKKEAMQIIKLAMPRAEGPLWDQPNYETEYDEDFYPDLDKSKIEYEKKFDNIYHGRNVKWIGTSGRMVRADAHYVYPIQGNIFYDEKISQLTDKIISSPEKIILYAPYGEMSRVDAASIKESIEYQDDYGHAPLTTGDEELDLYLKNKDEYIENSWEAEDVGEENFRAQMEKEIKEAEETGEGDFGEFIFQIRDGNHRAFAAINAGEEYIWIRISNNQMQDIESDVKGYEGHRDILE